MSQSSEDRLPTVYIEGLHQSCTQEKLREAFSVYGHVAHVHLKEGRHGHARKFAFLSFTSSEAMAEALASTGTLMLDGAKITVKPATSKQQHMKSPGEPELQQYGSGSKHELSRKPRFTEVQARLLVTHVETPVCFYAQTEDNALLGNIYETLAAHCPTAACLSGKPKSDQVYGSKYSVDGNWYRCKLFKQVSEFESMIFYIDYGNCEVVKNASLVHLPANISQLPPLARKYHLYGIDAIDKEGSIRFCEGTQKLLSKIGTGAINAKIYDGQKAELFGSNGSSLGQLMVDEGYCVATHMHLSLCGDTDGRPQPVAGGRASSSNPSSISSSSDKHGKKHTCVPSLMGEQARPLSVSPRATEYAQSGSPATATGRGSTMSYNGCSSSASATSCASSLLDLDLSLNKQSLEYRTRAEQLTVECTRLKEQVADLESRPGLDRQLTSVMETAAKVKKLRQTFRLDSEPIVSCIAQLSEEKRRMRSIADTLLPEVDSAASVYLKSQEDIRLTYMSLDKTNTPEMVRQRDEARERLCETINKFEKQVKSLDLDGRKAIIKDECSTVQSAYADLLSQQLVSEDCVPDDHLEQLLKWQAGRSAVVSAMRESSDIAVQKLCNQFAVLLQSLDMVSNASGPVWTATSNGSFEADIKSCYMALTAELANTHIIPAGADVALIQRGMRAVTLLASEVRDIIASLEQGELQYTEMRDRLIPWIKQVPDLSPAMAAWKHLKMLRSRLRHRLADRQDIIENVHDDSEKSSNDLAAITDELSRLQPELQQCCATLEETLGVVAADCCEHFPELALQHSDLSLPEFAKYRGLYSPFRDLEHFSDVRHLDGSSNWSCSFNGVQVEIRPYQVGSPGCSSKAAVLTHFMKVKQLWESELLSVFFSKNPSEVLVQVVRHAEKLANLRRPLSDSVVAAYSVQILLHLQRLHAEDFAYGSLNPQTVFVEPDGCILDVPGLPCLKNSTVDMNGLTFNQEETSKLADVKDFGKLLLWMYCPEQERPAHSHVSHNRELYDLVSCLLYGQSKTVEEILRIPFFASPALQSTSHLLGVSTVVETTVCAAASADPAPTVESEGPVDAAPLASPVQHRLLGPQKLSTSAWLVGTTNSLLVTDVGKASNAARPSDEAASSEPATASLAAGLDLADSDEAVSMATGTSS